MTNFISILLTVLYLQAQTQTFAELREETKKHTTAYLNDYLALNFDANAKRMHEDISFHDPTTRLVFAGEKHSGKAAVMQFFKTNYASIVEMKSENMKPVFSADYGIFAFTLKWKLRSGGKIIAIAMPLVVQLKVKDGKIIEHRDFADYSFFNKQYAAQANN